MSEEKFNKDGSPRKRRKDGSYKKNPWDDPNYREKQVKSHSEGSTRSWKDPEVRARRIKGLKEHWADSGGRAKHIEALNTDSCKKKQREAALHNWSDPEYRELQHEKKIAFGADPEYQQRQRSAALKFLEENPEHTKELGERLKKYNADHPEKAQEHSIFMRELWKDPEFQAKMDAVYAARPDLWDDPEYREKTLAAIRDPENRKNIADTVREVWADQEYRDGLSGENSVHFIHGQYIGGRRPDYGPEFTEQLCKAVRDRDEHTCALCGEKWVDGPAFAVHHINYDRSDNSMTNLITLCNSCHGKTGAKRKRSSFQHILSDMMLIDEHFDKNFVLIA